MLLHSSRNESSYRPEIDGLRAIAVIINHFSKDLLPCSTSNSKGEEIFIDDDHISKTGSASLYSDFSAFLRLNHLLD